MVGDPTTTNSLEAAGVRACKQCLILFSDMEKTHRSFGSDESSVHTDARAILCYSVVKALIGTSNVLVAVKETENIDLITDVLMGGAFFSRKEFDSNSDFEAAMKDVTSKDAMHNPHFIAGNVFLPQILDSLLCQSFFNRSLLDVLSAFTLPQNIYSFVVKSKAYAQFKPGRTTFADIFVALATARHRIPFALMRHRGRKRILIACPKSDLVVEESDRIYCIMRYNRRLDDDEESEEDDAELFAYSDSYEGSFDETDESQGKKENADKSKGKEKESSLPKSRE